MHKNYREARQGSVGSSKSHKGTILIYDDLTCQYLSEPERFGRLKRNKVVTKVTITPPKDQSRNAQPRSWASDMPQKVPCRVKLYIPMLRRLEFESRKVRGEGQEGEGEVSSVD